MKPTKQCKISQKKFTVRPGGGGSTTAPPALNTPLKSAECVHQDFLHHDRTDKLDLNDLCTTFVRSNERRQSVFRK